MILREITRTLISFVEKRPLTVQRIFAVLGEGKRFFGAHKGERSEYFLVVCDSIAAGHHRDDMNREELEKRVDELAREFAKSHDEEVKAELEALSKRVAEMKRRLV